MLLSYETLTYWGEGAAAVIATSDGVVLADIGGNARPQSSLAGYSGMPVSKVTGLKNSNVHPMGSGVVSGALPKAACRFAASIKVNELSQDDVTGAVLEAKVEGGLSLKDAVRLLLAVAVGDATGLSSSPVFKSIDGLTDRITGTVSTDTRTITGINTK